jgi:endo-alpha-N-acetylgalactosaminidase
MEKLWTCVSIGADQNEDGKVDFQDGAILRRDDCQQEGQKSDALYAETLLDSYTMVAMNFASQAQCPFLRISDNAKKLSLAMDDFPQHIIIKGYNAQGHDSCNGDYTKFNQAAGGLNDFNVMLEEGKKHNISYGVHINHTEMYPEYVGPTQDLRTSIQGWNWLDSARLINRYNDILDPVNDTRKRIQALNDITNGNIEHIYVDVFFGTRWPMFTMIDQINSMGIAVSTEYPREMDKHSAFCHHIGERENFQSAGNLVRFVNHTYQDIFEQTPLFRGEHDRNFIGLYGYEGNSDFNKTVREFYLNVLPNRYLVQFPIMQYETTDKAVLGRDYNIVARVQDGKNQILKDGHLLADGNKVFIPWDPETEDKIYHWNDEGGTTQWYLPKSWSSCQQVVMYPLSDKGRGAAVTLDVVDGQVTLTAEAKQGYVIYPSEKAPGSTDLTTMEWTKGGHIKDAGFDSFTPGYGWEITSNAGTTEHVRFENNNTGNTYLTVNGKNDAEIRQTAVELTPDKGYSAAVWTQVTDGREAAIEVWDGDQLLARNYMTRSNVKFGFSFRDCFGRYMHRMKVNFTAPKSGKVTVVCKAAEGLTDDAKVIFDDVRVMENEVSDLQGHDMLFDFENVDESVYPFVADGNSNHTHLSETNEGYTVDTISGQFSMKISDNHMRTLPITVRLEPNTTYEFNMDYLLDRPSNNGFTLGVKSDLAAEAGAKEAILENRNCGAPAAWTKQHVWENFQSIIKEAEALLKRTKPQVTVTEIDTMIQKLADAKNGLATKTDKSKLKDLYEICSKVNSSEVRDGQELVNFLAARSKAEELLADDGASQKDVNKAYEDLNAAFGLIVFRDGIANEKLDRLMEEARKALEEEKGTEEQRKALEDALKDAENAIKTQLVEDVMRSETALQNALNSLEKQWTVTFRIETEEQSIQVVDGQSVDRPENPVKDGYSFVGWYTEDGTKYDFSLPVTQDLRLIARFEKQDVVNPDPENPDGESGQKPEEKPSEPAGKPGDQTSDVDQNKNESVQTGDSIPATCIFMLFLSAVGILVIVKKRKRG